MKKAIQVYTLCEITEEGSAIPEGKTVTFTTRSKAMYAKEILSIFKVNTVFNKIKKIIDIDLV